MQSDLNFYGRYFAGIYLYLRQYKANRPWKGLLGLDRQKLVRSPTIAQLESLGDALWDFDGMADLEAWFKPNLSPS